MDNPVSLALHVVDLRSRSAVIDKVLRALLASRSGCLIDQQDKVELGRET